MPAASASLHRAASDVLPAASYGTVSTPSPLLEWFLARKSGPSFQKWPHYFEPYERHLARFANRSGTKLLEIGIDDGGSLAMWRHYLGSQATIYGADIVPTTDKYQGDPFFGSPAGIFIGDQESDAFWSQVKSRLPPGSLSIIIDDGGHSVKQQKRTLDEAWALLAPGGVYLCEDVHGGDNAFAQHVVSRYVVRAAAPRAQNVLPPRLSWGGLRDDVATFNQFNHPQKERAPNEWQQHVASVSFYPYVIVVEKLARPRLQMTGSVWAGNQSYRGIKRLPKGEMPRRRFG